MNRHRWGEDDEELELIDPLKGLAENAKRLRQLKEAKRTLIRQAVLHGYSNLEMGRAMNQTDTAVRLFRKRNFLDEPNVQD